MPKKKELWRPRKKADVVIRAKSGRYFFEMERMDRLETEESRRVSSMGCSVASSEIEE